MILLNRSNRRLSKISNHKLSQQNFYIFSKFLTRDFLRRLVEIVLIIQDLFEDNLWFLIFDKRRFDRFSRIMKIPIIAISVYLHNTLPHRSRGPLSDGPVRFQIHQTVFPQKRVKVSKFFEFFNLMVYMYQDKFDVRQSLARPKRVRLSEYANLRSLFGRFVGFWAFDIAYICPYIGRFRIRVSSFTLSESARLNQFGPEQDKELFGTPFARPGP